MSNREALFDYYQSELSFIRRMAVDFAKRNPGVATRLLLEPDKCEDPHVERLIEAFAMMTARVRMRLDDEFPELTDGLFGMLYPHYLAPIPSSTIVQFHLDPGHGGAERGITLPRHTVLQSTRLIQGVRCRYRTCYPVSLWPIEVAELEVIPVRRNAPGFLDRTAAAIRIVLRGVNGKKPQFPPELTFFIDANPTIGHGLYQEFLRAPLGVALRRATADPGAPPDLVLTAEHLRPMGLAPDEGLLELPPGSHHGYRLLQEYFSFPDKFMFVRFTGLERVVAGDALELLVLLDRLPTELVGKLRPEHLKLGCTPAVNLFPWKAEPYTVDETTSEIDVVPSRPFPMGYEIHSITSVSVTAPGGAESRGLRPFYAMGHADAGAAAGHWHATRRTSTRKDDAGTDVSLTIVDRTRRAIPQATGDVLHVEALCTNRDLPGHLPFNLDQKSDFQVEGRAGLGRIQLLRKPTAAIRSPHRAEGLWRLTSHLSLNYLSLAGGEPSSTNGNGTHHGNAPLQAFRELLTLYDFAGTEINRSQITGLTALVTNKVLRTIHGPWGTTQVAGLEVELEFDRDLFAVTSPFLFATILERFLSLYVSINSFTQTVARLRGDQEPFKRWLPRTGERQLV